MEKTQGFKYCQADPDRTKVWEYVLLYVDDCLIISSRAENTLRNEIGKFFELKEESIRPPIIYLVGQMWQVMMPNGVKCWIFGSAQYVKAAVSNVKDYLAKKGKSFLARAKTSLSNGYRPEIDITDQLGPEDAAYYQSLIGVLRWMVELGRIDICYEVSMSMMSSHLALPRVGHLEELFHLFGCLDKHHNAKLVFDPKEPKIDEEAFAPKDWFNSIYGEVEEELPPNMPRVLGSGFKMRIFVDSDHAAETVTCRSRTGFLCFLNQAPINWVLKKQGSCETSTFSSKFVVMKNATEYAIALQYKVQVAYDGHSVMS